MNHLSKTSVTMVTIDEGAEGQRIDNFLTRHLKGVPKSHVYRILRSGEVRVNSKRIEAAFKLSIGDVLRIPPIRVSQGQQDEKTASVPGMQRLKGSVVFEDEALLVIDKPAGIAVHGGSGISRGVIEQLRLERPQAKFLELVHRLDKETSGILLLAKKRSALVALHEAIRSNAIEKRYLMLVKGAWPDAKRRVKLALKKYVLASGERRVNVEADGQHSETVFYLKQRLGDYTLLEAELITGRTHQLRVQLAHLGYPILGDDKYGDFALNKQLQKQGLKRMFLHSAKTVIRHPVSKQPLVLEAPLPPELQRFITTLTTRETTARAETV